MRPAALPLAALVALTGCYTIRYERRSLVAEDGAPRERWNHAFVGGTIPGGSVPLVKMCPEGVAAVESEVDFVNGLAQVLTSGGGLWLVHAPIWEPTTVRVVCARPGAASRSRPLRLVVLPLQTLGGVPKETAQLLGDALAGELRRRPGVSVLTQSDVTAMLGVEKTRQMLGCSDGGCMAEVGGALGADRVVHGSLGRVGESLVVNLSALDAKRGTAAASTSQRLRGAGDEAFLDALPAIADTLVSGKAAAR